MRGIFLGFYTRVIGFKYGKRSKAVTKPTKTGRTRNSASSKAGNISSSTIRYSGKRTN